MFFFSSNVNSSRFIYSLHHKVERNSVWITDSYIRFRSYACKNLIAESSPDSVNIIAIHTAECSSRVVPKHAFEWFIELIECVCLLLRLRSLSRSSCNNLHDFPFFSFFIWFSSSSKVVCLKWFRFFCSLNMMIIVSSFCWISYICNHKSIDPFRWASSFNWLVTNTL